MAAPEAFDLVDRERRAFQALYPKASIQLERGTSRQAVGQLYAARSDLAAITRELRPEEREAASQGGLPLEGYRFARDAVVMVVHPSNAVENVALEDIRTIYGGSRRTWSEMGGAPIAIAPVARPAGSDIGEYFSQEVLSGEPIGAAVFEETTDSAVVARVARDPRAIGFVSLAHADQRVKTLRVATLTGLPYWKPDGEAVYKGDYPLTRFYNLYVRTSGAKLANGFITFVTSMEGQTLVREAGLLPTAVPVRFVRRSPMLGSH